MHRMSACLVLSGIAALASCSKTTLPEAAVQTVRMAVVERVPVSSPERYSATIVPNRSVDLAFQSAGPISQIHLVRGADGRLREIQAGDLLPEGTVLATVRAAEYTQRVEQNRAQKGQAEAQLRQTEADLRQATFDYERAKNLYASASLIKPQFDQAQGRYEAAQAAVAGAKAAIDAASSVVEQSRQSLGDTILRAPFRGWITNKNVQLGSLVGSSTVGFSMIDTHLVKAVFALPDVSLKAVQLGKPQSILMDAISHPVNGTVTSISPEADLKGHVFLVEVTIPNQKEEIRPGMTGSIELNASKDVPRLLIPIAAIVASADGKAQAQRVSVYRIRSQNGRTFAEACEIGIGSTYGNSLEVIEGLEEGDRIIALGASLVRNGQEVRLLP